MDYSAKRNDLCSRENAERVAHKLFETTGENISVIRQNNPLQPFLTQFSTRASGQIAIQLIAT